MNINSSLQKTPIAVIGLSSIFADARNVEEFWTNIIQAKDSIMDVPDSRWSIDDYYDPDMMAPDKTYCKRGGFIPKIDFNPMEFGLPPNILEVTDASQLLGLVAARDALTDAGYGKNATKFTKALKEKTGVLLGVGGGQKLITPLIARLQYPIWEKALRASGISEEDIPRIVDKMKKAYVSWNENAFPGLLGNVISGRITNRFDLGGINSVVDAACAASLSAIKMSISELVEGRCDMMLTGGVDTDNSPFMYMSFSKTPAFSKSGNISPFSDKADGMLIGEGLGMLVLKRLEDAEQAGDQIYAVIKGVGTSSDGRFKSVYAPRPSGQALAMNRAYEDAGFAPASVGLLEAHGTGTGAGDPTEFTSMQMVFGANNPKKQHIALGSVKSQIGHTKAAAGAAGIIKAVLSLHHKVLPPTINVEQANTKFDIENSAIYINTETRPWLQKETPRRAGVSAFGFGGINVHLVLEEYLGKKEAEYRLHEPYKTILIQADNPTNLRELCQARLTELQGSESETAFQKLSVSSKGLKLVSSNARIGFIADSVKDCIDLLQVAIQSLQANTDAWSHPKGIHYRPNGIDTTTQKVVALFAGQGSQYVGMGKELANAFPEVSQAFEKTDTLYQQTGESPLSETVFPIPVFSKEAKTLLQKKLTQTQNAQPAIGTLSMGQYKVLKRSGFEPQFTAGHSFGELTALWAAGVYDEDTFLALSKARGAAMAIEHTNTDPGTMLAVKAGFEQVQEATAHMQDVFIANVNSNSQVILAGSSPAIKTAELQLQAKGFSVIPLSVSAAFHTSFVKHAQQPFSTFLAQQKFSRPQTPVYSNTTGEAYPDNLNSLKALLKNQILKPVLFKNQIENIHQAGGRIFIEFGPKGILTNLVKDILKDKDHIAIAINPNAKKDSDLQFRQAAMHMQVLGLPLSNIDPYKKDLAPLPPKSKLTVQLSGNNYVSAPTQKAYQDVLNDGFQVAGNASKIVEKIVTIEKIVEVPIVDLPNNNIENEEEMINKEILQLLQATLESFKSNQTKSLEIFERFMNDQNQQSQQLIQLLTSQLELNNNSSVKEDKSANNNFNSSIPPIIPETPLSSNGNGSNGNGHIHKTITTAAVVKQSIPTVIATPTLVSNEVNTSQLEKMLLDVVSEKTGYPAEMLELNMDMEADLGIDSIKRVEIFGALTQKYPELSGINPNELTELRTLGEIVSYVSGKSNADSVVVETAAAPLSTPSPIAVSPVEQTPPDNNANTSHLEKMLLDVVSEKTGYPAEMLELNMDMEADLGIDSIKRVEIFGALTQKYPELSGINPNELTELRTLGEIVSYVSGKSNADSGVVETAPTPLSTPSPVAVSPVEQTPPSNNVNTSQLEKMLLDVVSEKTGYPAEMLELNMDMEADLGIDSIKRVEIFGALTQKYPELSGINPNELTELRTLGEIVSYVSNNGKKKNYGIVSPTIDTLEKGMVTTGIFNGVDRFEIGLEYLPQPDFLEYSLPDSHLVLITNNGSVLTKQVLAQLEEKGNRVVVLNFPNDKTNLNHKTTVNLSAYSDEAVKNAIQTIHKQYGKIGTFIHLHPHFEFQNGNFTQHFNSEKEIVKALFFIAKHLQKDLNELGVHHRASFLTVSTIDGKLCQGKRNNISVIGGGIPGLVKCLNLEWSPVFCRALDLQPELDIEQQAKHIIGELHDPNVSIVEVAISDEGRKTTSVNQTIVPEQQEIKTTVSEASVFLVSGGARGVTASCVIEMAKTFHCKFILLGRSSFEFEVPPFAKNENDEGTLKRLIMNDMKAKGEQPSLPKVKSIFKNIIAKKEIEATLTQIKSYGGDVVYVQGDVTNLGSFKKGIDQATATLGTITGIIHGAGRLADKYIQDKTENDFENVLSVKLNGLLSLLAAVDIQRLDHLVLFSSVAGFYGNVGQTDYAIANEILSKAAHLFKTNHPNTQVSAINWGAWDSGMVSGELKAQFEAAGITLVDSNGGAAMLVNELNTAYSNQAQVIIGGTLPAAVSHIGELQNHRIRRKIKLEENQFLNHHVIQDHAVLPFVNATSWMVQTCENLYPDFKLFRIEDIKLFKGILFDGNEKNDYLVELKELEKNADQIVFEVLISSEGEKLPVFHYKASVTLHNKKSKPETSKFTHKLSGDYPVTAGAPLYKEGALFHGKYFQGIKEVLDCSQNQIVLSCKAPQVSLSEQGQFPVLSINTFFTDLLYQGMVIWVQKYNNGAKSLPLQTDHLSLYKPIPFEEELFVNITIVEATEVKLVANCTVYDQEGNVYLKTSGAVVTISKQLVW